MSFQLSIITPDGKIFDETIEGVRAPGEAGSFGVLGGHAPMVAALTQGALKISTQKGEKFYTLGSGVLEVNHQHQVLVLSDDAQDALSFEEAQSNSRKVQNN